MRQAIDLALKQNAKKVGKLTLAAEESAAISEASVNLYFKDLAKGIVLEGPWRLFLIKPS